MAAVAGQAVGLAVRRAYRICGLTVGADLELEGVAGLDGIAVEDAEIAAGSVRRELEGARFRGPTWECGDGQILLKVPKVGRLSIEAGRRIEYEAEPGRTGRDLAIFLLGSGVGALLHQREEYVLHASAVAVDGGAAVFCGASGAGKSTLAAALARSGLAMLTDDVCRIRFVGGEAQVVPDGRQLKLWADTVDGLGVEGARGGAVREGLKKYWVSPEASCEEVLPLRAIYFLHRARVGDGLGIERARMVNAVELLRAHAYRPRLVTVLGQEQMWLERSGAVLGQAGAWRFGRAWDLGGLARSVEELRAHWRTL